MILLGLGTPVGFIVLYSFHCLATVVGNTSLRSDLAPLESLRTDKPLFRSFRCRPVAPTSMENMLYALDKWTVVFWSTSEGLLSQPGLPYLRREDLRLATIVRLSSLSRISMKRGRFRYFSRMSSTSFTQ